MEIEAKLRVDSLSEVQEKLTKCGAEFVEEQMQRDYYFNDATGDFVKADKALRLRRQRGGFTEKIILSYKGPREKDNFKKRREIEFEVNSAEPAEKLLCQLGYESALVYEKKRKVWRLGGCEVALDELPLLGTFVEIEGPDDKSIGEVQKDLELGSLSHIMESYSTLMVEKLKELGKEQREVFF